MKQKTIFTILFLLGIFWATNFTFAAESICSRGDILHCDDFEDRALGQTVGGDVSPSDYTNYGGGIINADIANTDSTRLMELVLKTGRRDSIYPEWSISPQQDAVYARWYAKWSPGFIWNSCSNKHFYFVARNGDQIIWRVALLIKRLSNEPNIAEPVFHTYNNQTDNEPSGGEMMYHQNVGTPVSIVPNNTYSFEVMVKPDTFGVPFSGEIKLWINGELKTSFSNVSLRKSTFNTPINKIWITSYYGCTAETSPQDQSIYYDNIVVSTASIGLAGTGSSDTNSPTVSLTAPTNGSTVSGASTIVSANASDNVGVSGVQFKLDGANLGNEDTTAPYSITWNTTSASNGSHSLTATARDAAGNQTTSSPVTVTVNNADTTAPIVTALVIPSTSSSLVVPITIFTATDAVGVTGYLLTEFATAPSSGAAGWTTSTPASYTFSTAGSKMLYAWAKDAAGNVSASLNAAVVVTLGVVESICSRDDILLCENWEDRALGQTAGWGISSSNYSAWGGGIVDAPLFSGSTRTLDVHLRTGLRDTIYLEKSIPNQTGAVYARWNVRWSPGYIWNSNLTKNFYLMSRDAAGNLAIWRVALHMKRKTVGELTIGQPVFHLYCNLTDYPDAECINGGEMHFYQNVGTPSYIYPDQWYTFEIMVDPGPVGVARSGALKLWINGELKSDYANVSVRKSTYPSGINAVHMASYYGGGGSAAPQDQDVYYDNIVVGTNYIGVPNQYDTIPPTAPTGLEVQ